MATMEYFLSKHAEDRVRERKIPDEALLFALEFGFTEVVKGTMKNPNVFTRIFRLSKDILKLGAKHVQKRLAKWCGLKVITLHNPLAEKIMILTVYIDESFDNKF